MSFPNASKLLILNAEFAFSSGDARSMVVASILVLSALGRLLTNAIGAVAIFCRTALRTQAKDLLLVAMLFLLDAIQGLTHVCAFSFQYGTSSTRVRCMLTVRNISTLLSDQSSAMMLMLISADRLLAICHPFWYYKQDTRYSWRMLAVLCSVSVPVALIQIGFALSRPHEIVPHCLATRTFLTGSVIQGMITRAWLYLSSITYVAVLVLYRKHRQTAVTDSLQRSAQWKAYVKETRSMTSTFGISALITFVFYALPHSMFGLMRQVFPVLQMYTWFLFMVIDWSTMTNLFLLYWRQPRFRKSVEALVRGKKLPDNLRDWFVAKPTATANATRH